VRLSSNPSMFSAALMAEAKRSRSRGFLQATQDPRPPPGAENHWEMRHPTTHSVLWIACRKLISRQRH